MTQSTPGSFGAKFKFRNTMKQTLLKWRAHLHRASQEVLNDAYGETSTIDLMFESGAAEEGIALSTSEDRNSATSLALTKEMRLTDEEESTEDGSVLSPDSKQRRAPAMQPVAFANYDAVAECQKLRSSLSGPFTAGDQIWKRRRELWTQQTPAATSVAAAQHREQFADISSHHYTRIYKKLVVEDTPLRQPLNLQDAITVINAGWVETQKWERAAKGLA
ncbi:LAMI_0A01948g1_1 [Lachancea mirantina]|uniref:LAMI_0A01948g1_1 n=1 Tax=Lachancea mirantina TaxID=1230905 RepID=A0A1G4IMP7_9SACH|nr:LAMI_0A01948g1_1 [Lachancea mirantina]